MCNDSCMAGMNATDHHLYPSGIRQAVGDICDTDEISNAVGCIILSEVINLCMSVICVG